MTLYNVLQLGLAGVVIYVVAERARTLLYRAALERGAYLRVLAGALESGDMHAARGLSAAARPAWIAELASAALCEEQPADERVASMEELLSDLRDDAVRRLGALRALASVATSFGLLGAVLELIRYLGGDHGLAGLQAGLPQKLGLERVLVTVTLGVVTAVLALTAHRLFKRTAVALMGDLEETARVLRRSVAGGEI